MRFTIQLRGEIGRQLVQLVQQLVQLGLYGWGRVSAPCTRARP